MLGIHLIRQRDRDGRGACRSGLATIFFASLIVAIFGLLMTPTSIFAEVIPGTGGGESGGSDGSSDNTGPKVLVDQAIYPAYDTVYISGSNFAAGEIVTLRITRTDGTIPSEPGYDPWQVISTGNGGFAAQWFVPISNYASNMRVTATGATGTVGTAAFLVAPQTNLDQLHNGTTSSSPEWANGNINKTNSCYSEANSVPFRYFVRNLNAGTKHFFTISMEWTKGGVHAYDYLTNYDLSEAGPIASAGGPCGLPSPPGDCATPTGSFAFPDFLNTGNYTGSIPSDFFTTVNPGFVLDSPRNLGFYNITIDSVGKYYFSGTTSDREFNVPIYFTVVANGSAGIFWGGHLAAGSPSAWGIGNGSASVGGAPYHLRAKDFDGGGGQNQDRSIQNGSVCLPPDATISCSSPDSVCTSGTYTCQAAAGASTYVWTISGGTIISGQGTAMVTYQITGASGTNLTVSLEACNQATGCSTNFCCATDQVVIPIKTCTVPVCPVANCHSDTTVILATPGQVCIPGFSCTDANNDLVSCVVSLGTLNAGTVCFNAASEGNYTIQLIATDALGCADTCFTTVTVIFNDPPEVTCASPSTQLICNFGDTVCVSGFSYTDPNNNIVTVYVTLGTLTGNTVCFVPTMEGAHSIKLIAVDNFGVADTCETIVTVVKNSAPVCSYSPTQSTYFVCGDTTFTFNVGATDVNNNLVGCSKTAGPGTYANGVWTFTTSGPGLYSASFTCLDSCGATCQTTVYVTVTYNQPPVATCHADRILFMCEPQQIALDGFSCTDPDGNLTSCYAIGGTYSGGNVFFTPVAGLNIIKLVAVDACGRADTCISQITVNFNTPPVITLPQDDTLELCATQELCYQFSVTDPDYPIHQVEPVVSIIKGSGQINNGNTLCFTPAAGIDSTYMFILQACDGCNTCDADTIRITVDLNTAPVAVCPGNQQVNFVCSPSQICVGPFYWIDPDQNITSETVSLGTLSGGNVCFMPDTAGVYTITYSVTDACNQTSQCQTQVTVAYTNQPPVAACPSDKTIELCDLTQVCIDGFSCSDPDGNLISCTAIGGTLNAGSVCFMPVQGANLIKLIAVDACGKADTCETVVTVNLIPPPQIDDKTVYVAMCAPGVVCMDLPAVTGGRAPFTFTYNGRPVIDTVCFSLTGDAVISGTVIVTDSCGKTDQAIITLDAKVNTAPVVTINPPQNVFVCESGDTVCVKLTILDPNNSLSGSSTLGWVSLQDSTACFIAAATGQYCNRVIVSDSCGLADTVEYCINVTVNLPPVAVCPGNSTYTQCAPGDVCISGFSCSDPDGNLASCVAVGGTLNGNSICFTPVNGQNFIKLIATDACGLADTCETIVTVSLYSAPLIDDKTINVALCGPGQVCADLPVATGGRPPFTYTYNGRPVVDTVCFNASGTATVIGTVVVTDSCGNTDNATLTVNVRVNTAPVVTFVTPPPQSVLICNTDTVCVNLRIVDPDNSLTVTSQLGWFNHSDSTVCFPVSASGQYCDRVIVADSCGLKDTVDYCITIVRNSPPVCQLPTANQTIFQCVPTQVCLPISASDPNNNLANCSIVDGPGILFNGNWCYTPTSSGDVTVTIQCADQCGAFCEGTFTVTFDLNEPPVALCPGDTIIYQRRTDTICLPGFSCADPDNNLTSCVVTGGTLVGNTVCFKPVFGFNVFEIIATDACGRSDTCRTVVEVRQVFSCPIFTIEKTHGTLQGHYEEVTITYENGDFDIGGFDLLIAYDASALSFIEALPGAFIDNCDWEYFTYRFGFSGNCGSACPSGMLRIVALAETTNGPIHPSCYYAPTEDPWEVAVLRFLVSNDRTLNCSYVPIYFFWLDCTDNTLSSVDGDSLILDSRIYDFEGNLIWDEADDINYPDGLRPPFTGAPEICLEGDKEFPVRCLDFHNGGVDIVCSDSIDARGDINFNGVDYEVSDAVMFSNYFVQGLTAFEDHVEGSIAASDVNADGISLSVADLVYMIRVIIGDAVPYSKPIRNSALEIGSEISSGIATVTYDATTDIGAVLLIFDVKGTIGEPMAIGGGANMDMNYRLNGSELRVLIYNIGREIIPSGSHELLSIPVDGTIRLTSVEAADYVGSTIGVTVRGLPDEFELSQNFPNPFNPSTTINLTLASSSDWTVGIYNVAGQLIRTYSGYAPTGTVQVMWDGADSNGNRVSSGIYFYKATAGQFSATRKMVLMK